MFIDYQNVQGSARRCFHPAHAPGHAGQVDPLELAKLLVSRRNRPSELTDVRVYRGRPSPDRQATAAAANDRQADRWTRDSLVTVIRRPLNYRTDNGVLVVSEKGVDVALAVDLVRLAIIRSYDVAILVSRDTDLMPALETVRDLRAAWVEVAGWHSASRLRYTDGAAGPWCHLLDETDYQAVADHRNYTRP
ncbi:MAG TPA: NYN domain-containing protein [Pseudonocardiaceae bacterium]